MKPGFASCCMLSYNRPDFVREAILSCVGEAGYPLEMIVHDDGSNAETQEVLRELHDSGMISLLMLNAPDWNEGQGIALNRMFAAAKGDPIVKLDHDLVFEEDWLLKSVRLLEENQAVIPRIGALGLFKYYADPVHAGEMLLDKHVTFGIEWEEHKDFVGSAMVIPRSAWKKFGPFEERSPAFAEDAVFKQRIFHRSGWCNALFPQDLATNIGFGPGPSTIVAIEGGKVVVTEIKTRPKILGA